MKQLNFTIIKLTFCLIVGIIVAHVFTIPFLFSIYCSVTLIALLCLVLFISNRQLQKTIWFGILAFTTMLSIGTLVVNLHNDRQYPDHYSRVIFEENDSKHLLTFKIREVLKPTAYHDKYVIDILKVEDEHVSGKLLLNIQKDSLSNTLQVDDILVSYITFNQINSPLNPYQFDYKNYLKRQYIDHQVFAESRTLLKIRSEPFTIFGYAAQLRSKIDTKLKTFNFKPDELAIIDALLMGQRKDISQDTYNNYVNAGTIHILAVSGLHVGIILLLLNRLFQPIARFKHGNYIKISIIALLMWSFAIIAGLTPSISRAVLMFTVVAIGLNLKRPTNIFNTLAISMFFLLLIKPLFLFEVGFQMSYMAVLSIVTIQPLLARLWSPPNKVLKYFWNLMCVTTAAQIGVVPISLYYFHQFPGLFFLSNIVILPFLGFILGFGILVIILALLNLLPQFVADLFGFCISTMNDFVSWVSQQESFIFRDISFGFVFVVVSYLLIISLYAYFKKVNYQRLLTVLFVIMLVQGALWLERYQSRKSEFIVFHKSRFTLLGQKTSDELLLASNLDSLSEKRDNAIRNYKVGNSIASTSTSQLESVYDVNSKMLLIVDSLGVYNVKSFKPEFILLRNSPKINLTRLIDSLNPGMIIADGSNYKSYIERWKLTCKNQKIPFHQTNEKGAFVITY